MKTFADINELSVIMEFEGKLEMPVENHDLKIIDSVLNGNVDDFVVLVNKHRERVFLMTAKRIPANDIEDVTQEAFIRAFKNLHTFSRKKPFANWLSIIVLRTCCDYWRKNSKRRELTAPADNNNDDLKWLEIIAAEMSSENHYDTANRKELKEILDWTLKKLAAEDRTLVEIIYFEGSSLKEAAKVLDWGLSKTKVRAMRARHKMRKILKQIIQV
jgi:RNA polymerase sigma-70 factor (ECF subfamily)